MILGYSPTRYKDVLICADVKKCVRIEKCLPSEIGNPANARHNHTRSLFNPQRGGRLAHCVPMSTPISRSAAQNADSAAQPAEAVARSDSGETHPPACPSCGTVNPPEASHCAECGGALFAALCPHCQARVLPEGDICEACGASLLPGQCRFCYARVPDGADFCAECGCSQSGITCAACGTLNFFDFCSHCSQPLTEAAQLAAAGLAADPQVKALLEALREAPPEASPVQAPPVRPVQRAEPTRTGSDANPSPALRHGLFSDQQRQALRGLTSLVEEIKQGEQKQREADRAQREAEAARQRAQDELQRAQLAEQEERRQRQLQSDQERSAVAKRGDGIAKSIPTTFLIRQLLDSASSRTFADAQEARRFNTALIESIPEVRGLNVRGWLCNRFNCMHANPNGCSAPQFGGKWIVES
jgi:Double zinc ribbon